ncbi:DNA polymerase I [Candidatus Nitrosacidococcus tergens]|uniref:DNA polymerase I n=1 Tax=Candidatus Nitrosacidococcus tergens TaxID=553981 RepID=A0A7G1QB30_9GAMM|nr:DNA polymerase I [Candidatus Nitrosacidococcus tergens]CAB1276874.1 fused DNA polymerase I 5'->3' exonuclease; 3'->5' polymerase; 3'->5' exonuclease [Candidatus Nitrosacidococcus tergens]
MKAPTLILVDGSFYLFRAFHALPPLTTSYGQPTGAIYGVANMLRGLINEYQPQYIGVMFDAKGKTFRHDLYDSYKAHRPSIPDELAAQIQLLHELIHALGFPLLCIEGVEADDVIGTLAKQASTQGMMTIISSGDKDLAQLVNHQITLINPMNQTKLNPEGVKEKFGVFPEQIIDYLILMGDSSDNIPGVPGIGPKTAAKLLNQYGTLDSLLENIEEIKGKLGENLRAHQNQFPLVKQLTTICTDIPLDLTAADLKPSEADTTTLLELYKKLEFKTWLTQLEEFSKENNDLLDPTLTSAPRYETIFTLEALSIWLARLKKAKLFAFDLETNSLNYKEAEIVGLSFAITPNEAAYVPVGHYYLAAPTQLSCEEVLKKLKPLLEDLSLGKIGQNLKFDRNVLANYEISLEGIIHDSMLESYVWNSTGSRHNLDALALKYLQRSTITFEEITGKGSKKLTFDQVEIEKATIYAAEDADISLQLHHYFWPKLQQQPSLYQLYQTLEIPLIPVLSHMECHGVQIDKDLLKAQSDKLTTQLKELEQSVFEFAGESFNLASPKQLQTILYDKLNLPAVRKTPTGQASTSETVLQELAHIHPLPRLILEYRTLHKLKTTYTDRLPLQINPSTRRIHTSYHQAAVSTGRLSSSDPNLQNIPIKTLEGRQIRQAFIAPLGYCLLAADYSQIELRIMAHLSNDEGLLSAFNQGEDIHQRTAAEIFSTPLNQVTLDQRRSAKAINFGLIYGMSAHGLVRELGVSYSDAQNYIDRYFQRYPKVKEYMDEICREARSQGYVETLFGRRLYLPEIHAKQPQQRRQAERVAINAPMQGSAADIIKKAMINTYQWLQNETYDTRMIMQVHDELVFEVPKDKLDTVIQKVQESMCTAAQLKVPLIVDIGYGLNWDTAH